MTPAGSWTPKVVVNGVPDNVRGEVHRVHVLGNMLVEKTGRGHCDPS